MNNLLRQSILALVSTVFLASAAPAPLGAAELLGVDIEVDSEHTLARVRTDREVQYKAVPDGLDGVVVELRPVQVTGPQQLTGGGLVRTVHVEPIAGSNEPATRVRFALIGEALPQFDILPGGILELRFDRHLANEPKAGELVAGARLSVEKAPRYDAGYRVIPYPGGDPGWEVGCGVDLVVRAYRQGEIDLQQLIHQDILRDATAYGVAQADSNIDHRRLRNLDRFLKRRAERLPTNRGADWQAGDLVLWSRTDGALADHVGIVSDRQAPSGRPLVIHHTPDGPPQEADDLFRWPIRAHLRWWPGS